MVPIDLDTLLFQMLFEHALEGILGQNQQEGEFRVQFGKVDLGSAQIAVVKADRAETDILYELLLKSGFPLTTPVEKVLLADRTVYSVAGGALVICMEPELTLDLIRAIAEKKPERVVCLDESFAGNDQLKANAVQIFKPKEKDKVLVFKTV